MNVLELFSGTHSVGNVCKSKGMNVVSLDINDYRGKYPPTIKIDIMEWDYTIYPPRHFDILWASPPCVFYSHLQYSNINRQVTHKLNGNKVIFTHQVWDEYMDFADNIVKRVLDIIDYFKPKYWFIENPKMSRLKDRDFMKNIYNVVVSYCKYSNWGYRKDTRIWTNETTFIPLVCNKDCNNRDDNGKHTINIGNGTHRTTNLLRYRIPPRLIEELLINCLKKKKTQVKVYN